MKSLSKEQCKKNQLRSQRCPDFHTSSKSGFTIIELTLSMAFIGVLLITIAIIITNITAIYQKGLALKAVNSVGRSLTDEFTSAISEAPLLRSDKLCSDPACSIQNLIFKEVTGPVTVNGVTSDQQLGGVFCTGIYSYIWNTKQGLEDGKTGLYLKYQYGGSPDKKLGGTTGDRIHLARINDPKYRVCEVADTTGDFTAGIEIDITKNAAGQDYKITDEPVTNLLTAFDLSLELYQLRIFSIAQEPVKLRSFISGSFILGTERGGIDIMRSGDYCELDGNTMNLGSDFNYCAINKFNFAARTAGVSDETIGN